jgi:uncharacterized DUF497 family protein
MKIEYDKTKAQTNLKKHGVSFEEAATVLDNPLSLTKEDSDSDEEQRFVSLGRSDKSNVLTVV